MAGEGGTGEKFNLPNTCPKWTSWGALEWHWTTDHEYINFLAVGALWAEILSPEFRPKFQDGRRHGGRHVGYF